jgi:eukaryotic-like serine/threonine-protein kinase
MSVLWRGHDAVLGRSVAIKVLADGYAGDVAFRERMRREARAAARLCHPQVATVFDFGEHAGAPYMGMELIDGPSLAEQLRAGPLPWRRALAVCADVAAGLAATHAAGLVHHDVKPGNVMLGTTGAKLVDFGISAEIGELSQPARHGALFGTPAYVAPERLTGGPARPASDVYALGLLLYRTLTGRLPFEVSTRAELLRAHLQRQPRPLPHLRGLPEGVRKLLLRCLAKDPTARPSAAELARAWSRAAERPEHPVRPRMLTLGTVAATALVLSVAVADSSGFSGGAADRPAWRSRPAVRAALATEARCAVSYRVTADDGRQFAGTLTVRNTGTSPIPASTLAFTVARAGTVVVPAPALDRGAARVLPFQGRHDGGDPAPARFVLGATICEQH